jgi:hypothetical protein
MNDSTRWLQTFGDDIAIPLRNPGWRLIAWGCALAIFGCVPLFIDSQNPRAFLAKILCPLLVPIGAWMAHSGSRYVQLGNDLALEITWKAMRFPVASTEIDLDLAEIRKIWMNSANGQRTGLSFEHADGKRALLPSMMLAPALDSVVAEIVTRRSELRRAGVKSKSEMCAAEAYLAAARAGQKPVGVRVRKTADGLHVPTLIYEIDAVTRTAEGDAEATTYVPPALLATLREGGVETKLKRLRGV